MSLDTPQLRPNCSPKRRLKTLADLDKRTRAAQQAFALRDAITADLGGADRLSAMERELVDNAALLGSMLKAVGATYLTGQPIDAAEFMAMANAQRRLLEALGLVRRPRNVTPSLSQYLAGKGNP